MFEKMFSVQVDDREDALKPFLEVQTPRRTTDVGVCRLTIGDVGVYWTQGAKHLLMVFERKTWDDLAGSIKDGRIDRQLEDLMGLRSKGTAVFLIVEGKRRASHAHIDSWNLTAKLSHIMIRHGIPILYTGSPEETVSKIFEMSDSYPMEMIETRVAGGNGGDQQDPLMVKREQNIKAESIAVLGGAPAISYSTAGMLLRYYTIMELLTNKSINLAELQYPVSGAKIGNARAADIVRSLGKRDTHIKMLTQVKGVTKSVAGKIVAGMDNDVAKWTEEDLADIAKTPKRRLGKAVSKKIITLLNYKIQPLNGPTSSSESGSESESKSDAESLVSESENESET